MDRANRVVFNYHEFWLLQGTSNKPFHKFFLHQNLHREHTLSHPQIVTFTVTVTARVLRLPVQMDIVTCCVRSRYVQDLLYVGRVFVYFNVKRTLSVSDIRCVIPMWEDVSQLLIQVCMYGQVLLGVPVILAIITATKGMNACVVLHHPLQQLYGPYGSNCMATTTVTAVWHACECGTQCALVAHCCYY